MEFNFSKEEIALIKQGLNSLEGAEVEELLRKIDTDLQVKEEDNYQMLHDFYGAEKEFEVVAVNEANQEKLEDIMYSYEDTNKLFYDDENHTYSILEDQMGCQVAVDSDDWEEWLSNQG